MLIRVETKKGILKSCFPFDLHLNYLNTPSQMVSYNSSSQGLND